MRHINVGISKDLVDRVDEKVAAGGDGFRSRAEYINAAVREYLNGREKSSS